MAAGNVTVPHQLGTEEAVRRITAAIEAAKKEHGAKLRNFDGQWNGATYSCGVNVMGVDIRSTVAVEPAAANVHVELPMLALMFKGAIEKGIRDELGKVLA
jgi:hypothetical protein